MAPFIKKALGRWGEDEAAKFLERKGFKIIDKNFQTSRGEIDIVAKRGSDFYFVEVKTRETGPMATDMAVTPFKKLKFKKTVAAFCVKRGISDEFGLVCATVLVVFNKTTSQVKFRLAAW